MSMAPLHPFVEINVFKYILETMQLSIPISLCGLKIDIPAGCPLFMVTCAIVIKVNRGGWMIFHYSIL